MPRVATNAPREPTQATVAYIRDLQRVWRQVQSLILHGLNPLLEVWPRSDAYNPLARQPLRRPIGQMTDLELQRMWPGIPPGDLRRWAPWATSRDEVLRVAFPGQGIPAEDIQVETFLRQAVLSAQRAPAPELDIEPFEPNAPGPGAFRLRPLYQPPVLYSRLTGEVLPGPPRPRVLSVRAVERQLDWIRVSTHELVSAENLTPVINAAGERVNRWTTKEVRRIVEVDPTRTGLGGLVPTRPAAPVVARRLHVIDPYADPRQAMQLRQWAQLNTNLIESGILADRASPHLRPGLLGDVSDTVRAAHAQGLRVEVLAQQLKDRFGVSDSRAALIARDQTLKLNGQLNRSKQQAAGVTHYRWATSKDERVRKSHQKLEGSIQSWDVPPAVGHPGEDYQCFPGSALVTFVPGVVKLYRARYSGQAASLVTASGETVLVTPNHPLLTDQGWLPAGAVDVGHKLVLARPESLDGAGMDEHDGVTFEELFDFFAEVGVSKTVDSPHTQFYGDVAPNEEIQVVDVDWGLMLDRYPSLREPFDDIKLAHSDPPAFCPSHLDLHSMGLGDAAGSFVRFSRELLSLVRRSASHPDDHCFRTASWLDTCFPENAGYNAPVDAQRLRDGQDARIFGVEAEHVFDDVVSAIPCRLVAPVYTLESHAGFYHAPVVCANCRCRAVPIIPGLQES